MSESLERQTVKFVSVINKVLMFPSYGVDRVVHDYLDQWIPLFSRKGIKQLTLESDDRWEITAHNFSSLGLTHLRLAYFWFPCIPAFGGLTYTSLRIIELIGVATSEENIFDCPVLEKLTLMVSYGLSHTNFRAPNLKCLHQHYRKMISEYSSAGLENLREYSFRLLGDPPMTHTETPNVVNVLSSLHKIEKLSIVKYYIKVFGSGREEMWAVRVLLAASFSFLWWWRLKDEVEALVVVAEVKRQLLTGVGVADVVGWWLYYVIVTVGMIRVVKGVLQALLLLLPRKAEEEEEGNTPVSCANDEKV